MPCPGHAVLFLLLLAHLKACGAVRAVESDLTQSDVNASSIAAVGAQGSFRFKFINNSTLPLNILALPKYYRLYSTSKNEVAPKDAFEFFPSLGAYTIDVVINDGNNGWVDSVEAGWGMAKDGVKIVAGVAAGSVVGTSGVLATGAATIVGGAVATVAWPAVLTTMVVGAAFWGVAMLSSMACSMLTESSLDFVRNRVSDVLKKAKDAPDNSQDDFSKLPASWREKYVRFSDVVTEGPVQEATRIAMPELDQQNTLLTNDAAKGYINAMQMKFSDWVTIKNTARHFVLTGGFSNPTKLKDPIGHHWTILDFVPLYMGEIAPTSGCFHNEQPDFWQQRYAKCEKECANLSRSRSPKYSSSCVEECAAPFYAAYTLEQWRATFTEDLRAMPGKDVLIQLNVTEIEEVAASVGLLELEELREAAGKYGVLKEVRLKALQGLVEWPGSGKHSWLPLEIIYLMDDGVWALSPADRKLSTESLSFGECWSGCKASAWSLPRLGSGTRWCYASNREMGQVSVMEGSLCSVDEECGFVAEAPAEPQSEEHPAAPWRCVSDCS